MRARVGKPECLRGCIQRVDSILGGLGGSPPMLFFGTTCLRIPESASELRTLEHLIQTRVERSTFQK